jgi:hypothetical protein
MGHWHTQHKRPTWARAELDIEVCNTHGFTMSHSSVPNSQDTGPRLRSRPSRNTVSNRRARKAGERARRHAEEPNSNAAVRSRGADDLLSASTFESTQSNLREENRVDDDEGLAGPSTNEFAQVSPPPASGSVVSTLFHS